MAVEIERKFLVRDTGFLSGLNGEKIVQGYIADKPMTTRVRIREDKAYLTLKGKSEGISRGEWEYPIPVADAEELMAKFCEHRVVHKTRYLVPVGDHTFEVDVFEGKLAGLVMAEVELLYEEEEFEHPDWLGVEVSTDFRFANSSLAEATEVPQFDEVVRDGFLFIDRPGDNIEALVIMRGPHLRFSEGDTVAQVEALLKGRSGVVLVNMVLNNGSADNLFRIALVDDKLAYGSTKKVTPEEYPAYAKLCAPHIKEHKKHLDFSLIYNQDLVKLLKNGKVPSLD